MPKIRRYFTGHDTTASAISWAIYALGKYPDLQQKMYEDVCDVLGDNDTVTKYVFIIFTTYFTNSILIHSYILLIFQVITINFMLT